MAAAGAELVYSADHAGVAEATIAPNAAAQAYGSYMDAPKGSPASSTAPTVTGDYELRYVQGGKVVLARPAIRVTAFGIEEAN